MTKFKIAYAKTHLASLIKEANASQEVVIARDETPLVRLVPIANRSGNARRHVRESASSLTSAVQYRLRAPHHRTVDHGPIQRDRSAT